MKTNLVDPIDENRSLISTTDQLDRKRVYLKDGETARFRAKPVGWLPELATPVSAIGLAALYLVAGTVLPFYNKVSLGGWPAIGFSGFGDFPLTAATVQLAGLCVILTVYECVAHFAWLPAGASWAFGRRHWRRKLKLLAAPALMFALVMSLSNAGIVRPPLTVHLLLRSTEIWWTMLFGLVLRRELPTAATFACCLAVAAGAVLVSVDYAHSGHGNESLHGVDVAFNLVSAFCSGALLAVLRDACVRLRQRDPSSRVLEATLLKSLMATLGIAIASVCLERDGWTKLLALAPPPSQPADPQPAVVWALLAGGALLTAVYQALVVALATFSFAVTVALLAQCKIVPQIPLAYAVFRKKFDPHPLHVVGLLLIVVSAVVYAVLRFKQKRSSQRAKASSERPQVVVSRYTSVSKTIVD